jgi:hypothetical protein
MTTPTPPIVVPALLLYDTATDQLIVRVPAAGGEGDVTLLRLDVKQLSDDDKRRLRDVRDPKQVQPAPGDTPVTRR